MLTLKNVIKNTLISLIIYITNISFRQMLNLFLLHSPGLSRIESKKKKKKAGFNKT